MFRALKTGEAARVIPIIGTLIPVILLLMSAASGSINLNEVWAILILLSGLIFLVFQNLTGKFSRNELLVESVSALFFANSYYLLKIAYGSADFLSVFVYSRLILVPVILAIVIIPFLRKKVLGAHAQHPKVNIFSKTGGLLFIGQAAGGASQLMLTFAISLASPAVINSIQGIQYIFIFILSLILAKRFPLAFNEKFSRLNLAGKVIGIILIFLGLWMLSFSASIKTSPKLGVTFSPRYAAELGLNADEVFEAILTDLKPKAVRLPIYWDEVEKEKGKYDFSQLDKYLQKLEGKDVDVVLVVGFKQPRWPECFHPLWSKSEQDAQFNKSILELVKNEVSYFKKYKNIKYWQLENEPFLNFGVCPRPNYERVLKEFTQIKEIDTRPILMTDSGELSDWFHTFKMTEVFGTTLYRNVWNPWFGVLEYPWPPIFYKVKAEAVKLLTVSFKKDVIISELQAEPWPDEKKSLGQIGKDRLQELFPAKQLVENIEYARLTSFSQIYLWGVEWWYFMKVNQIPDYWQSAKMMFNEPVVSTRF